MLSLKHLAEKIQILNNAGVSTSFLLEKEIEKETVTLQLQIEEFEKQTKAWMDLLARFNTSLKVSSQQHLDCFQ